MITCTIEAKHHRAFLEKKATPFILRKFIKEGQTSLPIILNELYQDLQEKNGADEVRAFNFIALLSPTLYGFAGGDKEFRKATRPDLSAFDEAVDEFVDNGNPTPLMDFLGINAKKNNEAEEANRSSKRRKKKAAKQSKVKPVYVSKGLTTTAREAELVDVVLPNGGVKKVVASSIKDPVVKANGLFTRLFLLAGQTKPVAPFGSTPNVGLMGSDIKYQMVAISADKITEDSRIEAVKNISYQKGGPIFAFVYTGTNTFVRVDELGQPLTLKEALAGNGIMVHTFVRDEISIAQRLQNDQNYKEILSLYESLKRAIKDNPEIQVPLKVIGGRLGIIQQPASKTETTSQQKYRINTITNISPQDMSISIQKYEGRDKMHVTFTGYDYYNPTDSIRLSNLPELVNALTELLLDPNISALDKQEGFAWLTGIDSTFGGRYKNLLSFSEQGAILTHKGQEVLAKDASSKEAVVNLLNSLYLPAFITKEEFEVPSIKDGKVELNTVSREQFVYDNYSLVSVLTETSKELVSPHATIAFELGMEAIEIAQEQLNKEAAQKSKQKGKKSKAKTKTSRRDQFIQLVQGSNVLKKSDELLNTATEKEQEAARVWWNNSPLSQHIPLNRLFGIVNSGQLANFGANGITLYAGSNYTDVYHEAWHGFSQLYLTKDEKIALYKEVQKILGKDTSYLKAEEELAEDFRKFMLSDGKRVLGRSRKINNIFKRILDFLRALFGPRLLSGAAARVDALERIAELYDGLAAGSITEGRSPSYKNSMFLSLDKGIQILDTEEYLSTAYSKQVSATLDSMIVDILEIQGSNVSVIFKGREDLNNLYNILKLRAESQILELEDQLAELAPEDETRKFELETAISVLQIAVDNFGSLNSQEENTTIGYHLRTSDIMNTILSASTVTNEAILDEEDESGDILGESNDLYEYREMYDKSGNEVSPKQLLSAQIDLMIRTIPEITKEGEAVTDMFGMPKLKKFGIVFNQLQDDLIGVREKTDVLDKLEELALEELSRKENGIEYNNTYEHILNQVAEFVSESKEWVTTEDNAKQNLLILLWQGFNKAYIPTQVGYYTNDNQNLAIKEPEGDLTKLTSRTQKLFLEKNPQGIDLKEVLAKHDPEKFGQPGKVYSFIRDIGFDVPITYDLSTYLADFGNISRFKNLYNDLVTLVGKSKSYNIKNPYKQYSRPNDKTGFTGHSATLKGLFNVILSSEEGASVSRRIDPDGKNVYNLSLNSSQTQMVKLINSLESLDEFKEYPQLRALHPDFNPHSKSSKILQSMFDFTTGERKRHTKRRSGVAVGDPVSIDLFNILGVFSEGFGSGIDEVTSKSQKNSRLGETSKIVLDLHTFLSSKASQEQPRVSDKSTSIGISIKANLGKASAGLGRFVRIKDTSPVPEATLFYDKLQSEIELMRLHKNNDSNVTRKGDKDFALFSDIIEFTTDNSLKESLEQLVESGLTVQEYFLQNEEVEDIFLETLEDYFNNIARNLYRPSILNYNTIKDQLGITETTSNEEAVSALLQLLKNYAINAWFLNSEIVNLFAGTLGQYKTANDFIKRYATTSTGNLFAADEDTIQYVNKLSQVYAESIGAAPRKYNGKLNTIILEDISGDTGKQDLLGTFFIEGLEAYAKDNNLSQDVIDKYIEEYKQQFNEADAQAYITFDTYRTLSIVSGEWNWNIQEPLYQKAARGEQISIGEVKEFFPIRKYQYHGPILNAEINGAPINSTALHKYSLKPMIPTATGQEKRSLDILHEAMVQAGIDYAVFESGSKINNVGSKIQPYSFDGSGGRSMRSTASMIPEMRENINEIHVDFLKDVTKVNSKFKQKVTASSQLRGLIGNLIYDNGVVIEGKEGLEKEYKKFVNGLESLIELKKREISNAFKSNDANRIKKVVAKIKRDLSKKETPEHIIDQLDKFLAQDSTPNLDSLTNGAEIEKMLLSVLNKELVRTKMYGEALVQVSSAFMENESSTEYSNDLRFYTYKDGKVLPAQAKIALQGDFVNLLASKYKGEAIGTLERLNEAIKDPKWLDYKNNRKLITISGVRIPVQGLNSMEVFEIAEFLPPTEGTAIVLPSEIATKSGGDYDVDKLTLFFPRIDLVGIKDNVTKKTDELLASAMREQMIAGRNDVSKEELAEINKKISKEFAGLTKKELDNAILDGRTIAVESRSGEKGVQNDILGAITNILLDPSNYLNLISPNSTNIVKNTEEGTVYDKLSKGKEDPSVKNVGTVLSQQFNLRKQQEASRSAVGLGIVASANVIMVPLQSVTANMPKTVYHTQNKSLISQEEAKLQDELIRADLSSKAKKLPLTQSEAEQVILGNKTILLKTPAQAKKLRTGIYKVNNVEYGIIKQSEKTIDEAGGKAKVIKGLALDSSKAIPSEVSDFLNGKSKMVVYDIINVADYQEQGQLSRSLNINEIILPIDKNSIGNQKDSEGVNYKSQVVEQLINGFVDFANDPWIFDVELNDASIPDVIAMIALGVPYNTALALVNTKYIKAIHQNVINKKDPLLLKPKRFSPIIEGIGESSWDGVDTFTITNRPSSMLTIEQLLSGKYDKQAAAIYLQALPLIKKMGDIIRSVKVDTVKANSINHAQIVIENLSNFNDSFSQPIVEQILNNSIQGIYKNVKDFQVETFKDYFPIRSNTLISPESESLQFENDATVAKKVERYKQHFISFLLQNYSNPRFKRLAELAKDNVEIAGFKIEFKSLPEGSKAVVFEDTIVIDYQRIQNEFYFKTYPESSLVQFATEGEYVNHVIMMARIKALKPNLSEEDLLDYTLRRSMSPSILFSRGKNSSAYTLINQWNSIKDKAAQEAESDLIEKIFIRPTDNGPKLSINARYNLDPMEYIEDIIKLKNSKDPNVRAFFNYFSERIALQDNLESHDQSLIPFIDVSDIVTSTDESIKWFDQLSSGIQQRLIEEFDVMYSQRVNNYLVKSRSTSLLTPKTTKNILINGVSYTASNPVKNANGTYNVELVDNSLSDSSLAIITLESDGRILAVQPKAKPSMTYWQNRLGTETGFIKLNISLEAPSIEATTTKSDEEILEQIKKCGI